MKKSPGKVFGKKSIVVIVVYGVHERGVTCVKVTSTSWKLLLIDRNLYKCPGKVFVKESTVV